MTPFTTTHPATGDRITVTATYRPRVSYRDPFTEPEEEHIELESVTIGNGVEILASLSPREKATLEAEVRQRWLDQEAGI